MKSKIFMLLIFILVLFSLTAVSADNAEADSGLNSDTGLVEVNYKSYDDFYHDIENSTTVLEIENDYKYSENDNHSFLMINNTNRVINGNNHIIDGSGIAQGFNIADEDSNVTINDLTFINCNVIAISIKGNVILNNVNFSSNFQEKGDLDNAVVLVKPASNVILNKCNFDFNRNIYLISASYANISVLNSNFSNTRNIDAPIMISRNQLLIENSTFENLSSRYGGAVNFKGNYLSVKNSIFKNISADFTGGAILAKFFPIDDVKGDDMVIEGCEFINVSSSHNGGAVYADLDSASDGFTKTLFVRNCNFTDSSSAFGGAIADQGGILNITGTNFINCAASELGGAVYVSWTNLTAINTKFLNCSAGVNAGAMYFDKGKLVINCSNFTDNNVNDMSSGSESVIYANDVDADIINSIFSNGIVAVYANFAENSNIENVSSTDLFLMNNTDYIVSIENNGIKLNLTNNTIVVDKLPSRFDIRDWGWASPLKFQGDNLACWAFATAGAIECSLLKATGITFNISEDNIQNLQLKYYIQGDARNDMVGYAYSGLGHSLSWNGIVMSQDDAYDERGMYSNIVQTDNRIHLQDAMIIFGQRNDTMDLIKQAIIKYGTASIQYSIIPFNYNRTNYTDIDLQPGHFVTLIGWDDNFPAEKFRGSLAVDDDTIPKGNGAWLVKDSESPTLSEKEAVYTSLAGYVWISYYNPSFLAKDLTSIIPQAAAVAYIFENTEDYHVNYQTDLTGLAGFDGNYTIYSNEFTSKYSEVIGAVGTYFNESGIDYSFDVYVNGEKVHSQSGVSEFAGFRTIVLSEDVPVKANDTFKVVFKNNAVPFQAFSRQHYIQNMSFVSKDGEIFEDITLENKTVCLKVYTKEIDIFTQDLVKIYKNASQFEASVGIANATVTFEINGGVYNRTSDEKGVAKIAINLLPGNYIIKTTFNGTSVENTIEVLPTLIAQNLIKYFRNASQFDISLIDGEGNAVSNVNITMNINGVFYNRTTNENGTARLNINLAPGEYILTAVDPLTGLMMSYNITVLPVLNASDIEMTYKDGTQFKATLVDGTGLPLAGVNITFNINCVFYNRTTDENGTAILNINLMAGKYIITSQYENAMISNTITIRD